jgi:branched-chain amino acid transport system substrate-binding protein
MTHHSRNHWLTTTTLPSFCAVSALCTFAALSLPACTKPQSQQQEIVIGVLADLTGPTADVGRPYHDGMLAFIDDANTRGGIQHRHIQALSEDYAYKVPTAEEKYKKYVQAAAVAVQGWGTGDSEALRRKVAGDQLPFMSASYAEVLTDPAQSPYNFVVAATYSDQMRIALDQIAAQDAGAQVAVFHHDSPFGNAPIADGTQWITSKGYQLGYQDYAMKAGATDFVGSLQRAKEQGAKYIIVQNVASPAATLARDIAAQKLDMKIVCLNWCSDELFVKLAGPAAEGSWMVQPFAPPSVPKPGHAPVKEYCASRGLDFETLGVHFVQGWYTMAVMAGGLDKLLSDGQDLTGKNLRSALESMDSIDTGGVIGPIHFSAASHRGASAAGVYVVEQGKLVERKSAVTPRS